MRYYPVFLDLAGKPVLLVGGGEAAARKLRLLRKAGAEITLVAPEAVPEIVRQAEACEIAWRSRHFRPADVKGRGRKPVAVHAATGRTEVDRRVAEVAQAAGVPVNVVDDPEASSFIMPAIVDRDPIVIGISSGGASPVLARRLRERIEALLPARLGRLAAFAERFRGAVAATRAPAERRGFWEQVLDGPIGRAVLAGDERRAGEAMLTAVNHPAPAGTAADRPGVVHIVGAGPGDPDLLTLKALRLIQDADVILYDALVDEAVLERARRDAERVYVGKTAGNHSLPQARINALLAGHARAGRRVVRLKGGDPFVFGRGGEELLHLKAQGIETEVVPGVTAAAACAASAGVPLTHRGLARAVTFVTGHAEDGEPDLDWAALTDGRQTLAIYMGLATAPTLAGRLIAAGAEPSRPVAVIEKGSRPDQRVVPATLGTLATTLRAAQVEGPAMIIVGNVAGLAAADVVDLEQAEPRRAVAS